MEEEEEGGKEEEEGEKMEHIKEGDEGNMIRKQGKNKEFTNRHAGHDQEAGEGCVSISLVAVEDPQLEAVADRLHHSCCWR
mmetsp:Transcript_32301/g.69143  ORF Transcript_32301/g.69143 Transcript_32301/m.69143 type:complete len:81 (-) Transcript_32301:1048-1290(-)